MDYQGLTADDLANINALNRSFLAAVLGSHSETFSTVATHKMTSNDRARLASAPFLLFSLRERDDEYWRRLLDEAHQIDLIDSRDRPEPRIRQLQVAGLSFLWQLARRNPYVVRLVCGASVAWCDRLSALTLIELLNQASQRSDLLRLRFAGHDKVWQRLLGNGTAAGRVGRLASHHSALHVLLTGSPEKQSRRLSAAACAIRGMEQQATRPRAEEIREPKV